MSIIQRLLYYSHTETGTRNLCCFWRWTNNQKALNSVLAQGSLPNLATSVLLKPSIFWVLLLPTTFLTSWYFSSRTSMVYVIFTEEIKRMLLKIMFKMDAAFTYSHYYLYFALYLFRWTSVKESKHIYAREAFLTRLNWVSLFCSLVTFVWRPLFCFDIVVW